MAAIGGALRHWNPTSTLCVGFTRLRNLQCLFRLGDVNADRLLAVDVLAGSDRGLQVLHVEKRRRGDLNEIDVGRGGELLEGVRAMEEQLAVDGLAAKSGVELVEMSAAQREFIGKDVGQRHNLGGSAVGEGSGDGGAAIATAEQAKANGGVGLVAEGGAWLEQKQATCGSGLEKLPTVHHCLSGGSPITSWRMRSR